MLPENQVRHPVCLMKTQFYTNTACTSTTLYSVPGSHTGRIVPLLAGVWIHVVMCVLPWVIVCGETRNTYTNHQSEISGQSHERLTLSLSLPLFPYVCLSLSLSICVSVSQKNYRRKEYTPIVAPLLSWHRANKAMVYAVSLGEQGKGIP